MPTTEELMSRNVTDVFGERDPVRRRAAIEALYAEDAELFDPEGARTGWDGVDEAVRGVLAGAGDMAFSVEGTAAALADLGRVRWRLGPADGPPVVRGEDVAVVRDGRIARLYTFVEPGA